MAMDKKAYDKLDYPLCLLSAAAGGKNSGCIVNSLHQATSSFPAKFTVTLNKDNETAKAVAEAGCFSAAVLAADAPEEIINTFGYKSGRVTDKFAGREVLFDQAGAPYITAGMVSRLSCKVVDRLEIGNYILFVGQVTEAEVLAEGPGLTLKAFTDRGKATPPQATVYREMIGNGFRCTVCGYVYQSETISPDYVCPICGARAEKFVQQ
ncbi:MAG: flavin reductase [Firmicutes bacterium]|nr:flavin reductase [Bacillota bacterium]